MDIMQKLTNIENKMKIPKKFKLFATDINILWDNKRMNDKQLYGQSDYSASEIIMSDVNGTEELSEGKILDTYYHERTHMILDTMREFELSSNEKFVDIFSKLLRQSDETAEY